MGLLDRLDRYLIDSEYRINIYGDGVHIINYLEVVDFSNTKVVVRYRDGITIIEGENLVVSKMMDDELLITGKLKVLKYN